MKELSYKNNECAIYNRSNYDVAEHVRRLTCLLNGVPELLTRACDSPYDKKRLVAYLVNNGVRVEE